MIIGSDGINPSELSKGFVIPRSLRDTEEKKAEAPAGDCKGPREKLGKHPPEPGGAPFDKLFELLRSGHQQLEGWTGNRRDGQKVDAYNRLESN